MNGPSRPKQSKLPKKHAFAARRDSTAQTYKSIALVAHEEVDEAMQTLSASGEAAVLEYLKQWYEPGEGTLVSTRKNTWKEYDHVYEDGEWVIYYNTQVPYFGLVCRLPDF